MIIKPIPSATTDQAVVWQDEEANHRFSLQTRSVPLLSTHQIMKLRRLSLSLVSSIGNNANSNDSAKLTPTSPGPVSPSLPTLSENSYPEDEDSEKQQDKEQERKRQDSPGPQLSFSPSSFKRFFPRSVSQTSLPLAPPQPQPEPRPKAGGKRSSFGHKTGISLGSAGDLFGNIVDSVQKSTANTQRNVLRQLPSLNMSSISLGSSFTLPSTLTAKAKEIPSTTSAAVGKVLESVRMEMKNSEQNISVEDATFRIVLQCSLENYVVAIALDEATIRADWDCIHKTVFPKVKADDTFPPHEHGTMAVEGMTHFTNAKVDQLGL